MTWIFLPPTSVRTTSNSVFSSSASAAPAAPPGAAAGAAATAVTPNFSLNASTKSASSMTVMLPIASSSSSWFFAISPLPSAFGGYSFSFWSRSASRSPTNSPSMFWIMNTSWLMGASMAPASSA